MSTGNCVADMPRLGSRKGVGPVGATTAAVKTAPGQKARSPQPRTFTCALTSPRPRVSRSVTKVGECSKERVEVKKGRVIEASTPSITPIRPVSTAEPLRSDEMGRRSRR